MAGRTARGRGCRRRAAGRRGPRRGRRAARRPPSRCRPRTGRRCPSRSAAGSARRSSPPARGRRAPRGWPGARGRWWGRRRPAPATPAAARRAVDLRLRHQHDLAEHRLHDGVAVALGQQRVQPPAEARGAGPRAGRRRAATPRRGRACRRWRSASPRRTRTARRRSGRTGRPRTRRPRRPRRPRRRRPRTRARGVAGRVTAGAAAAPVHGVDGDVGLQVGQQRPPAGVVGHGAVHEHQRRPLAAGPVRRSRCRRGTPPASWLPRRCRSSRPSSRRLVPSLARRRGGAHR